MNMLDCRKSSQPTESFLDDEVESVWPVVKST